MRTVQKISLIFALLILSGSVMAESGLITKFDKGYVDWGSHTIRATGIGKFDPGLTPSQFRLSGARKARLDAEDNLLRILVSLKYTCDNTVRDLMLTSVEAANRIEEMVKNYRIVDKPRLMPDSSIAIDIEFDLSQELIAELIELSDKTGKPQDDQTSAAVLATSPIYFDCRGLKIESSLAPQIFSEKGVLYFSLAMVNYAALKNGPPVKYISQAETQKQSGELDLDKLEIINVVKINKCNVIIDDIDYANLISSEVHRNALINGQIIILVD